MKKIILIGLTAILVCGLLFATGDKEIQEAKAEGFKGIIKIGVLAPLTGTNAEYGKGFEVGTGMAVEEINAAGGANGYKLVLDIKDSKGDSKESSDLARKFGDDDSIKAIIGDFTSGSCMANAPIVDAAGIVQLSPTASNPDYAGMSPYCFSIQGRQDGEAPFFARYILQKYLGVKNVGMIYINSDWGVSCYNNFKAEADRIGLNIVEAVNYVQDEKDFSSLITKLRAANPEVVLIADQGAVSMVINQIRATGWQIPLTSLGPGPSEQLIKLTGKNSEGLVISSPFFFDPEDPVLTAWKNTFVERAGFAPTIHPACAYDCVYLLADAISRCEGEPTRKAIRDNLASGNVTGITGPLKFNETGDINRVYLICGVHDGQFVVLEGFDYAK